jgi:plastocyanin
MNTEPNTSTKAAAPSPADESAFEATWASLAPAERMILAAIAPTAIGRVAMPSTQLVWLLKAFEVDMRGDALAMTLRALAARGLLVIADQDYRFADEPLRDWIARKSLFEIKADLEHAPANQIDHAPIAEQPRPQPAPARPPGSRLRALAIGMGAAMIPALSLLLLLSGRPAPERAEEAVAKAVARPLPTATLAPTAQPTATPAPTTAPTAQPTAVPSPTAAPAAAPAQVLAVGTERTAWFFNPAAVEATVGDPIALTFTNNASAGRHNLVLVAGGEDIAAAVNTAGAELTEAGYIPAHPQIIAHTSGLLKAGQSETLTFDAPVAGTYIFLCTVPGHFDTGMRGTLVVGS